MTTATPQSPHLSDRAFRVLYQLTLHSGGRWTDVPSLATWIGVPPHAVRHALSELLAAGVAERERRYIRPPHGRPTSRTYFRLTDTTSEVSA